MAKSSVPLAKSAGLLGFSELVTELHGNPKQLIEQSGLTPELLASPDNFLPAERIAELLERAAQVLDRETFGIELGVKQNPSTLGLVGLTLQQCNTIGEAMYELQNVLHIQSQAGKVVIETSQDYVYANFQALVSYANSERQITDLALSVGFQILKSVSQGKVQLRAAHFKHAAPKSMSLQQQIFQCPLVFNSEVSGVVIDKSVMHQPLTLERNFFKDVINGYLSDINKGMGITVDEQIRILIRQLLPTGRCNLKTVSQTLGIDERTLQRRLKDQDRSFQDILNQERLSLALSYLAGTNMSLTQISSMLGYAELAVFSRNFKKWRGQSPTEYLKEKGVRWKYR